MLNVDISEVLPHFGLRESRCRVDSAWKRSDLMLSLRPDWQSMTGGAIAGSLVIQLDTAERRDEISTYLTGAALDLLVNTWPRRHGPPLVLETLRKSVWKVSGCHYIYLPVNNDATIGTCIQLSRSSAVTAILPRQFEKLKRELLAAVLGRRAPNIWSFDTFISWRTMSAAVDQEWSREKAVLEFLIAYNRRVIAGDGSRAAVVQIPEGLP
jgi:hypothetical protein